MMTVSELINKANANGMYVKQSFKVLSKLDEHQQELFLAGKCICCQEGQAPAEGIWDYDYSDEDGMHGTCIGYEQGLFCEGCEMTLPAEVLLDHEVISQAEYDNLCNPFDDYFEVDDKSDEYVMTECSPLSEEDRLRQLYLSIHPDASVSFDEWLKNVGDIESALRRQYCDDDDDLPF